MPWLRLWVDILDDPDLTELPEATCWAWVLMLAVAKEFNRGGQLPPARKLAHMMHKPLPDVASWTQELLTAGLLEGNGVTYSVHGWSRWQEPKDRTNAERQAKFKSKKKSPSGLPKTEKESEKDSDRESESDARAHTRDGITVLPEQLPNPVTPLPGTHATDSPEAIAVRSEAVRRWQGIDLEADIQANELIRTWGADVAGRGLDKAFKQLGGKERPWAYANTVCRNGIRAEVNGQLPAEKPKTKREERTDACQAKLAELKAKGILDEKGQLAEDDG